MKDMRDKIKDMLDFDDKEKSTFYLNLSKSDQAKNELLVKSTLKDLEINERYKQQLDKLIEKPHLNPSVVIFSKEGEVTSVGALNYSYEGEYGYNRYYVVPFFNHRNSIYENLYLLSFSKNEIKFHRVSQNSLEKVELDIQTFESKTANRIENKSIQHHGDQKPVIHGQNASSAKDRESDLYEKYLKEVANDIDDFLHDKNSELILAGTEETVSRLRNLINEEYVSPIELIGNFEDANSTTLLDKIDQQIESHIEKFLEETKKNINVSKSNELEAESFTNLLSTIKMGTVEDMYIGELGEDDEDYQNPIAPTGANYIAHEVLKYGGTIHYFPDTNLEFTENNLAYNFRF